MLLTSTRWQLSSRPSSAQRHRPAATFFREAFVAGLPTVRLPCRRLAPQRAQASDYENAATRLESLLHGSGDGHSEHLEQLVEAEGAEFKVAVSMLMGSIILLGSFALSALLHTDPWGGMAFSWHSLDACLVGMLAAAPVAAVKFWSWTPHGERSLPLIKSLHDSQAKQCKPWLSDLTPAQIAAVMLVETLPPLFLLFPAAQGGVAWTVEVHDALVSALPGGSSVPLGVVLPEQALAAATLVAASALCGLAASAEFAVTDCEYRVLESAVANADRYYRMMAPEGGPQLQNPNSAAAAFKAVAVAWVHGRMAAARAAATVAMLTTAYLGVLYNTTHDMAAPLVAAALLGAVDYTHLQRRVRGRRSVSAADRA